MATHPLLLNYYTTNYNSPNGLKKQGKWKEFSDNWKIKPRTHSNIVVVESQLPRWILDKVCHQKIVDSIPWSVSKLRRFFGNSINVSDIKEIRNQFSFAHMDKKHIPYLKLQEQNPRSYNKTLALATIHNKKKVTYKEGYSNEKRNQTKKAVYIL